MFETFNVPANYTAIEPVLSVYANGRTNGQAVHSGMGATWIMPVVESMAMPHAIMRLDIGGEDLTHLVQKALAKRNTYVSLDVARDIKETCVRISSGGDESGQEDAVSYKLPDGSSIIIDGDILNVGEALFNPSMGHHEAVPGLPQLIYTSVFDRVPQFSPNNSLRTEAPRAHGIATAFD